VLYADIMLPLEGMGVPFHIQPDLGPIIEHPIRTAAAVDALRAVECGTDRDAIRERTIDLNKATERLAETMMDAAVRGAVTSKRADQILEQK